MKGRKGRVIKGLKRGPNLEDNVTIYANSTILGDSGVKYQPKLFNPE